MANEQGWCDFSQITGIIGQVKNSIQEINNAINRLKHDKQEILDDPARKAEMKKIIDIHPLYTLTQLQNQYQKALALQVWLQDNGYI